MTEWELQKTVGFADTHSSQARDEWGTQDDRGQARTRLRAATSAYQWPECLTMRRWSRKST